MYKLYKTQDVRNAISSGLKNVTGLARVRLKSQWKNMTLKERCAAARSLVYMGQVAKNPDAYFSRAATQSAWDERANRFIVSHGLENVAIAYNMVRAPEDIIYHNAKNAFVDSGGRSYYNLCRFIRLWYYGVDTRKYAYRIVDRAQRYKNKLEYESAKCFMRPFVEIKQMFQR